MGVPELDLKRPSDGVWNMAFTDANGTTLTAELTVPASNVDDERQAALNLLKQAAESLNATISDDDA